MIYFGLGVLFGIGVSCLFFCFTILKREDRQKRKNKVK